MAALIGFGASAINPYMAFGIDRDMLESGAIVGATGDHASDFATARANYIKAPAKGVPR